VTDNANAFKHSKCTSVCSASEVFL